MNIRDSSAKMLLAFLQISRKCSQSNVCLFFEREITPNGAGVFFLFIEISVKSGFILTLILKMFGPVKVLLCSSCFFNFTIINLEGKSLLPDAESICCLRF